MSPIAPSVGARTEGTEMPALLEQYQSEREGLVAVIDRTLEGVEGRDLSDTEQRSITDTRTRIEALDRQIELVSSALQTRDAAADLTAQLGRSERRQHEQRNVETRSIGEQFVESDVFAEYRGRGTSPRIVLESRALPTGMDVAGNLYGVPPRVDITAPTVSPLLAAIPTITVNTGSIETVVYSKVAGGADVVAEKGVKPSVEFGLTVTPVVLDNIAGWTQMTRQMIEDAPAVRDAINTLLVADVRLKAEAEAAAALVAATLPSTTATTTQGLIASVRKGVGVVQAAGYNPNAVILNPADWADMDLDVYFGTSAGGTPVQRSFWGLSAISAASQPEGTATVADLGMGVQRYVRSGTSVYITDSHGETFVSNVFTVLAEQRAKTVVTRPAAFCECSVV